MLKSFFLKEVLRWFFTLGKVFLQYYLFFNVHVSSGSSLFFLFYIFTSWIFLEFNFGCKLWRKDSSFLSLDGTQLLPYFFFLFFFFYIVHFTPLIWNPLSSFTEFFYVLGSNFWAVICYYHTLLIILTIKASSSFIYKVFLILIIFPLSEH